MSHDFYAPRFDVRVSGITMAADVTSQILSVTYDSSLDTADMFSIVLRNANNEFTDSALFTPGENVELYMGYGDNLQPMMLGEITAIEPRFPESGAPTIAVSGYDKSYKLRHNEPVPREFNYMTSSMIVAQIAAGAILIPVVDPTPAFYEHAKQSGSDFAFIKELAAATFFDAFVYWDKLYFQFPRQTEARVLEWQKSLISFSPRLSTAALAGLQIIRGYNEALAQAVIGVATGALLDLNEVIERLGPSAIEMLASLGRRLIHSQKITSPIDALGFARAVLQDLLDGLYEGSGRCIGIPELRAGKFIKVTGVGKRFSGNYRLRKVTHSIDSKGYITDFDITQRAGAALLSLIRKTTDEEQVPPPDRSKKFYGVAIAKVTQAPQISFDPDIAGKLGARVKVTFPWLSDSNESAWARVVMPSASDGSGMYFMPDQDDMVIVAFQDGELSMPVVLGSVWDGPSRPPVYPPAPQNSVRLIKSKQGHIICLDDTKGLAKITLHSNGGHTITLDDTKGNAKITLHHGQTESEIVLEANGDVSLNSKKDINLNALAGNINLTAPIGKINLKAGPINGALTLSAPQAANLAVGPG